jgi:myo-inositol-1(or 4)-monophosphatase
VALMKRAEGVRRCGAAAIDLTLTACGTYDGFWELKLHAWDLAAGVVIVREAGGRVTDYQGHPVDIRAGWIVASNGLIHDPLLEAIAEVRAAL